MTNIPSGARPNVVIHIFSKGPLTYNSWTNLIDGAFSSIAEWSKDGAMILDLDPDDTTQAGRVYEIQACVPPTDPNDKITLEECKSLRNDRSIQDFQERADVQVVLQPFSLYLEHKTPGLAVFDMDSTLIQQEVIDELARAVGRYDQVAAVTEAAMRGELDFQESLRERVAQLKGVPTTIWEHLKKEVITVTPGAVSLIKVLKAFGWKTAVLSGGFTPLANWLKEYLGLDYAFANHLATENEDTELSGELVPGKPIIDGNAKRDTLIQLAEENGIALRNTIAVGDGSNDLLMMGAAGFGIAYNAKPKVQEAAPARLNTADLLDIGYLLGVSKEEVIRVIG